MQRLHGIGLSWFVITLLISAGACSDKSDKPDAITPSPTCDAYLTCVSAATPQAFPAALATYDRDGPCWKSAATAKSCSRACSEGLKSLAAAHPAKTECNPPQPDAGVPDSQVVLPSTKCDGKASKVDMLFVIDNSNSMADEQLQLSQQFNTMITALNGSSKSPDLQIGIISTDLGAGNYSLPSCEVTKGDRGKLMVKSGCTARPTAPYISVANGQDNVPNGTVAEAFACMALLGTGGCGFENQLEAARQALDPALKTNPGFLRQDSLLVVVFVTDEDDCSAKNPQLYDPNQNQINDPLGPLTSFRCFEFGVTCDCSGGPCKRTSVGPRTNCRPADGTWLYPPGEYLAFLRKLRPKGNLIVAAIAGPTTTVETAVDNQNPTLRPSCQSAAGKAVPGIRLWSVVAPFSKIGQGEFASICNSDYAPALTRIATMIGGCLSK